MSDEERWNKVKEAMGNACKDAREFEMGPYYKEAFLTDIKHIGFSLSRYKFISKLVAYREHLKVIELGSQEAWGGCCA